MAALEFAKEYPSVLPWEVQEKVPLIWWKRWILAKKAESARMYYDNWSKDPDKIARDKNAQKLMLWSNDKDG